MGRIPSSSHPLLNRAGGLMQMFSRPGGHCGQSLGNGATIRLPNLVNPVNSVRNPLKFLSVFSLRASAPPREISSSFCFLRLSYISRFKFPGFVFGAAPPRCASAPPREYFADPSSVPADPGSIRGEKCGDLSLVAPLRCCDTKQTCKSLDLGEIRDKPAVVVGNNTNGKCPSI